MIKALAERSWFVALTGEKTMKNNVLYGRWRAGDIWPRFATIHPPASPTLTNHWPIIDQSLHYLSLFGQCSSNVHSNVHLMFIPIFIPMSIQCVFNAFSMWATCRCFSVAVGLLPIRFHFDELDLIGFVLIVAITVVVQQHICDEWVCSLLADVVCQDVIFANQCAFS